MRSVVLKALSLATRAAQVDDLLRLVVPTVYSLDWSGFTGRGCLREALGAISHWSNWPALAADAVAVSRHIDVGTSGGELVPFCRDAAAFANFLRRHANGESDLGVIHARNASTIGFLASPIILRRHA